MTPFSVPAWSGMFVGPAVWPAEAVLSQQGEIPSTVYIVDSGTVKLSHFYQDGDECVIDIVRAPALVGGAFVVAARPSIVEAITLTTCDLRWCSASTFLAAVVASNGNATRAVEVLRWHCAEITDLLNRTVAMGTKSSSARLDYFIRHYGELWSGQDPRLRLKQSFVASFLNITPEHMSRLVKKRKMINVQNPPK